MIKAMFKKGLEIDIIAEISGLTLDEVSKFKNQQQQGGGGKHLANVIIAEG